MSPWQRWLRFNGVGIVGALTQIATIAFATQVLHVHYLPATVAGVVVAVAHNFAWHIRWTWRDRRLGEDLAGRFLRFGASNGAVSLAGNALIMAALVGVAHLPVVVANLVAIAVCGVGNYWLSDRLIFRNEARYPPRPVDI